MARSGGRYRGQPTLRNQSPRVRSGSLYCRWSLRQHVSNWEKYSTRPETFNTSQAAQMVFEPFLAKTKTLRTVVRRNLPISLAAYAQPCDILSG
jgi:hypothetical protein